MRHQLLPYREGEDAFDAFIARPEGDGPHPLMLVCHAWAGRGEFAEARARQLAELGYVGAAVDLYGVGKRGTDAASSNALMSSLIADPPKLRRRLQAAHDAVRALDGVDGDRVGAIGYCFGGLCAILMARMGLPLRGVASFHGLLKVGEPLEAEVKARILVLHGQDDPMVAPADVGAFAEEMKRIDADWQLHAYRGAVHAFTNPEAHDREAGSAYDAEADRRSWAAMRHFFEELFAG
ncbi:MAG: dienelactone hydrolase family protein [Myxococcales bacterium]|nr:dienelactone hydrolase family protein [Myxococcales bacterium]